jgi:N-methylhydantoinase B
MPVEAAEQTGPIIIWRKELREISGSDGERRGRLGQCIEIEAASGHEFDFSTMFDGARCAVRGRNGGTDGVADSIQLDDGAPLRPKGWQHVPAGRRLLLDLPGGGGFGDPARRSLEARRDDIAKGYVTETRE